MKDFALTVDSLKIHGKLFCNNNSKSKPAVLFIHGWESKQDRHFMLAEELANVGYLCITFDMRGHSISEGDHTVSSRKDFLTDVLAAYDFMVSQDNTDANNVTVISASFGAYMAALLSAERVIHALVLRVPADYRDEGFSEPLYEQRNQISHSEWKEQPHSNQETAALRSIHQFEGDLLIIESEKDELVPTTTVQSYAQAACNPAKLTYAIMENAPHSISHHPELQRQFAEMVTTWLRKR
jgi:uncharacterized protein